MVVVTSVDCANVDDRDAVTRGVVGRLSSSSSPVARHSTFDALLAAADDVAGGTGVVQLPLGVVAIDAHPWGAVMAKLWRRAVPTTRVRHVVVGVPSDPDLAFDAAITSGRHADWTLEDFRAVAATCASRERLRDVARRVLGDDARLEVVACTTRRHDVDVARRALSVEAA